MSWIEVSIKNWEKFNPRKDIKHPTWFALSNSILTDPDLFDFSGDEFKAFIYIMSEASKKNKPTAKINLRHAEQICRIPESEMISAIEKLEDRGVIENIQFHNCDQYGSVRARSVVGNDTLRDRQTDTTDTTGTTDREAADPRTDVQGDLIPLVPISRAKKKEVGEGKEVSSAIARYCEVWKGRYKDNPPITGKDRGILKNLVKDLGLNKARDYLEAYLQMPDSWFVTKRHDLPTLVANLNSVSHFMSSGKVISKQEIRDLDRAVNTKNLLDRIDRGEI